MTQRIKCPGAAATDTRGFTKRQQQPDTTWRGIAPANPAVFCLKLLNWHARKSGTLRGYAAIEMFGGLVGNVPIFVGKGGVPRASLPSHPRVEAGRVVRFEGKIQYASDFFWMNPSLAKA